MRVLITGDRGYIGPVLANILLNKGYRVVGYDLDLYAQTDLYPIMQTYPIITKDIREIQEGDLHGIDAVIHLAALSNDPLGELNPGLTEAINYHGTVKLAKLAKKIGIKRFVYASSQSMYGIAASGQLVDEDLSAKNPLTSYAATKWKAEQYLKTLHDDKFTVVCFRPSTVFGMAPRLRTDIVFNNLVVNAYCTRVIEVKSDGTPWRPVVHVKDVCQALMAGLVAPKELVGNESFNVGVPNGNYTVRQLAEAAQSVVPGSEIVYTGEHGNDSRTYRVSFDKIFRTLGGHYEPQWSLERGGQELVNAFNKYNLTANELLGHRTNRLMHLKQSMSSGRLIVNAGRWYDL